MATKVKARTEEIAKYSSNKGTKSFVIERSDQGVVYVWMAIDYVRHLMILDTEEQTALISFLQEGLA